MPGVLLLVCGALVCVVEREGATLSPKTSGTVALWPERVVTAISSKPQNLGLRVSERERERRTYEV